MRGFVALLFILFSGLAFGQIAILGEKVYTVSGPVIENGIVLVKEGKIWKVGRQGDIRIPADFRIMRAKVVTPGFIDVHSTVGLSGILNVSKDQDVIEKSKALQPELRAIDAYNPGEELVHFLASHGITTIQTGPAPEALSSGSLVCVKTTGNTVDEALIPEAREMISIVVGKWAEKHHKSPKTRAKSIALLRSQLIAAQNAMQNGKEKESFHLQPLIRVLKKDAIALITAQKAQDIEVAFRLAREFGYDWILDGGAEAYMFIDRLRLEQVPVFLHPPMARAYGEMKNMSFTTAHRLDEQGISFAFQSGYEAYVPKTRVIRYEISSWVANGLDFQSALYAGTYGAAKLLGIDNRTGSINKGKDADLVLFDGDPFEYLTKVCAVLIDGKVISEVCVRERKL